MHRGRQVVAALVLLAVLAAGVWLTYRSRSARTEAAEPEGSVAKSIPKQNWGIHRATDKALPSTGYILSTQESQRCNGAVVIKYGGEDWVLGIAWYDNETKALTDVLKRDELMQLLGKYLEVDRIGMYGIRHAVEDGVPEMYVGSISLAMESVWLQLDPDSCGVRSGWLVYRDRISDKVTRQRISW